MFQSGHILYARCGPQCFKVVTFSVRFQFQNQVRYAATDSDLIQDSIELETSSCTCRNQYTGHRVAEGKYRVSVLRCAPPLSMTGLLFVVVFTLEGVGVMWLGRKRVDEGCMFSLLIFFPQ